MRLPETRAEVIENIETFYTHIFCTTDTNSSLAQGMRRAMGWAIIYRNGGWIGAPLKFAGGAAKITPQLYDRHRRDISGTVASNRIGNLFWPDQQPWVDSEIEDPNHPAIRSLHALAAMFDTSLRADTRFYILRGEGINDAERAEVERLLNLIEQANLSPNAQLALEARLNS